MNAEVVSKDKILESVAKMMADKAAVRAYIRGKATIDSVAKKGIKLAKPL